MIRLMICSREVTYIRLKWNDQKITSGSPTKRWVKVTSRPYQTSIWINTIQDLIMISILKLNLLSILAIWRISIRVHITLKNSQKWWLTNLSPCLTKKSKRLIRKLQNIRRDTSLHYKVTMTRYLSLTLHSSRRKKVSQIEKANKNLRI